MILHYELVGAAGRPFSPNCWRTRLALRHKGLAFKTVPVHFAQIKGIADGKQKTVPVIEDNSRIIPDSWAIANYLEDTYPGTPSLFGGAAGRSYAVFAQNWVIDTIHRGVSELVLLDIHDQLDPGDKAYFRETRERRFGRTLELIHGAREARLPDFRKSLQPLRQTLDAQPWLGGAAPHYADYLAFGALLWPRAVSSLKLLADDDTLQSWFARCLDLYGGDARAALPPA